MARGFVDWGHLTDSRHISTFNIMMPKNSTSKRQEVASDALCAGAEAGYDFFSLSPKLNSKGQRFYVFGRYDYYNSMMKTDGVTSLGWCSRHKVTGGFNWYPIPQVILKGEYSYGILKRQYNNEPSVSLGVAYVGWFK